MLFNRKTIFIIKVIILLCGLLYCIASVSDFATNAKLMGHMHVKQYVMMLVKELAYGISFVGTVVLIELLERLAYHIHPSKND